MTKGGLDPNDRLCPPPEVLAHLEKLREGTQVATRYLAGEAIPNEELLLACQRFARAVKRKRGT